MNNITGNSSSSGSGGSDDVDKAFSAIFTGILAAWGGTFCLGILGSIASLALVVTIIYLLLKNFG